MDIRLTLQETEVTGLTALDRRRALGLPDGYSLVFTTGKYQTGAHAPSLEVDESFARAWFGPEQTTSSVKVRPDMLARGDVEPCRNVRGDICNDYAVTFADLTPERIKELYVAVRFAACREQVERLQQEVDTLRAQAEETEESQ